MRIIFLFFSLIFSSTLYGQRNFETLISDSKKSQKLILITINIPQRTPELGLMDPLEMGIILCSDGGCQERIPNIFEYSEFTTQDDNAKKIIAKYALTHFPINLIFDWEGELIIKNNSMFGDKEQLEKLMPLLTNPASVSELRKLDMNLKTSSIERVKYVMAIKRDSLIMTDDELIDLFVEKASEKDYDQKSQDLILLILNSVNSKNQVKILENLYKYGKNYIESDLMEFHKPELEEKYSFALFNSLFYAYRINDDKLFNDKISEAKSSILYGKKIEEMTQNMLFLYYKALRKPKELFNILKPSMDKQLKDYKPASSKNMNAYETDPKETLAQNLNNAAFSYYDIGGKDLTNLKTALEWSKKSNSLIYGNPALLDTYAHLLYFTNNKVEAIAKQKQAISLAKNLYKLQLNEPQIKEYVDNFEKELKKMEQGKL